MTKLSIMDGPDKGKSYEFKDGTVRLGRSPDNEIQMRDTFVSRTHLKITRKADRYFLEDLNSKNGTFLNGQHVVPGIKIEVEEGHPIVIGMSVICLGKGCSELVKTYLDSIDVSNIPTKIKEDETVILEIDP